MGPRPLHVLFVCTGNSARSILSEATLNHLGGGRFRGFSAGSQPTGRVHPLALRQLMATGMSTEGLRSKSWDEFTTPDAPSLDLVITVCDNAAVEACPVLFGDFITAHCGLPDPAAAIGSDEDRMAAFADAHAVILHRINRLISLTLETMPQTEIRRALGDIGSSLP